MRPKTKRILLVIAGALAVGIAMDLLQTVRPSPVSAVACTALFLTPRERSTSFLDRHHDDIRAASSIYDLPASLVAAVVADHIRQQTAVRNFTDCAGSALGANLSLGPGQIRVSTAAALQGASLAQLSAPAYRELRSKLLNPKSNIAFTALELRALVERPTRYPGISSVELLRAPHAMALAISEYRMGRSNASRDNARLGINAFGTLALMQNSTLSSFEHNADDREGARRIIWEYLRYINCESGIFNKRACIDWHTRQEDRSTTVSPN